jgi:hypothetical protein
MNGTAVGGKNRAVGRNRRWVAVVLVLSACTVGIEGGDSVPESSTSPSAPASTVPPSTLAETTTTSLQPPPMIAEVTVTGDEEMVFEWSEDACEPENIPDIASRAFRDAEGQVQLVIGHYVNYRMVGPSLDDLVIDCTAPIMRSDFDPDPSQFNDSEWITSPYTFDGVTIYAVVHNEYRGDTHGAARPSQCPSGERFTCLDTSITMAVSTDGGTSFRDIAPPPDHMSATLPYVLVVAVLFSGLRQPSNIVRGPDDAFYVFSNVSDYPDEDQWVCAIRSEDLSDPQAWRFWNGTAFAGAFLDPYREDVDDVETCAPLAPAQLAASVQEAVVFDSTLDTYVMFGTAATPGIGDLRWGVYYSVSDDLVSWSTRQLLMELPSYSSVGDPEVDPFYAYVSVLDPESESLSFDTTDGSAYLYITHFNAGSSSLDRDLVRFPIEFRSVEAGPQEWTFEETGDTEGWEPLFGLEGFEVSEGVLTMEAGPDPHFALAPLSSPAVFGTLRIDMRVSEGDPQIAQVFFTTETDADFDEAKSMTFDVIADGEFHEYVVELGSLEAWSGTITALRIDPVLDGPATIDIDRISLDRS